MSNLKMKIVLLIAIVILTSGQLFGNIAFANLSINAITNATVYIGRSNTTTANSGTISLTFPSNAYTTSMLSNMTCSLACTVSGLVISIQVNAFSPLISSSVQFTIMNIQNPSSSILPAGYYYQMLSNSNSIVESYNISTSGFNPGSIASCILTFNPNYVRKLGTGTFTVTPTNPIPANGSVNILFPTYWANIVNNDTVINASSLSCSYNSGNTLKSTMSCSNNPVTGEISLNSIFNMTTTSSFSFLVNPILSLPLTVSEQSVSIYSMDGLGNVIDNYTACTATAPNSNTISTMTLANTSITVSSNFTPMFSFTSTDLMNQNDTLKITITCSDLIVGNANNLMVIATSTFNYSNSVALQGSLSSTSSGIYGYYLPRMSSLTYVNSNTMIYLTNLSFTAPTTTKPQTCINISLYRANALYSSGTLTITPLSNTLNNVTLSSNNTLINANSTFTFSFVTSSPLSANAVIVIIIPNSIITRSYSSKTCLSYSGVSSTVKCTLSGQNLTVTNLFSTNVNGGVSISITTDGITNPSSNMPSSTFTISTYYNSSNPYVVDQSTSITYTATADTITSCTVSSSSLIVGASSTYTITYVNKNPLPANANIVVGLPIGLSLASSTNVVSNVSINSTTVQINPTYISSTTSPYYQQALNYSGIITSSIPSGTTIQIIISSIVNPNSTLTSASFSLFSSIQNYLIQSVTNGVTVTMTTPASFTSASITPNSNVNGDSTYYLVTFTPSLNYVTGTILKVYLASQISLSTNCTCTGLSGFTTGILTCSVSNSILSINLTDTTGIINSSLAYTVQVTGFTNARTYTTTSNFTFTTSYKGGFINTVILSGITNSQPNYILNLTSSVISPTLSYLNSTQVISFSVTLKNGINGSEYLLLYFPSVYAYNAVTNNSVCLQANLRCVPTTSNTLAIKISSTTNFNMIYNLSFTISGYTSPNSLVYVNMVEYFKLYTYQANNNPIDTINTSNIYTKTTFAVSCNTTISPCQTCSQSNTSSCLTCYDATITNSIYFQNNSCVSNCSVGFYPNSNLTCTACLTPCSSCLNQTACLSCLTSTSTIYIYYFSTNYSCLQNCPSGYYASVVLNNTCVPCSQNCLTCSMSSSNCTSCNSSYVYYNYSCISTCPDKFYNSTGSNICKSCDVSCYTCQNSSVSCLICATGYARSGVANLCTNNCSYGTVLFNGSCQCSTSCLTCSGQYDNCTTCNTNSSTNPYLYVGSSQNLCVSLCPTGTYSNNINCTNCPTGCTQCTFTNNQVACSSCNGIYGYYSSACYTTCPGGTFMQGNFCNNCSSPCSTCNLSASNCTSCISNYSLSGNACTTVCPIGYVTSTSSNGLVCSLCTNNCLTCQNLTSNCTTCSSGYSLYGNACLSACPASTIAVSQVCKSCTSPCLTCSITVSNCLTCISSYFLYNSTGSAICVSTCPTSTFTNGSFCITCQSPCNACGSNAFNCTACINGYLLQATSCVTSCSVGYITYQDNCLKNCPSGMSPYNNTCVNSSLVPTTLQSALYQNKSVPIPFLIGAFVLGLLSLGSKFLAVETFIPSLVLALWSILELISWFAVLGMSVMLPATHTISSGIICIAVGIISNYILNIINIYFYLRYIKSDLVFNNWATTRANTYIIKAVLIISTAINHKFLHLMFSKGFGSIYLKAPLSTPVQFTPINIVSGISVVSSVLIVSGCGLISYDPSLSSQSQLYMQCIDSLVLTILTGLCALWNIKKPSEDYFAEEEIKKYQNNDTFKNHETVEQLVPDNNNIYQEEIIANRGRKATYSSNPSQRQRDSKIMKTTTHLVRDNLTKQIRREMTSQEQNNGAIQSHLMRKQTHFGLNETSSEYISEDLNQRKIANQPDLELSHARQEQKKIDIEPQKSLEKRPLEEIKVVEGQAISIRKNIKLQQKHLREIKDEEKDDESIMNKLKLSNSSNPSKMQIHHQDQEGTNIANELLVNMENNLANYELEDPSLQKKQLKNTGIISKTNPSEVGDFKSEDNSNIIKKLISETSKINHEVKISNSIMDESSIQKIQLDSKSQIQAKYETVVEGPLTQNILQNTQPQGILNKNTNTRSQQIPPKIKKNSKTGSFKLKQESVLFETNKTTTLKNVGHPDNVPPKPIMKMPVPRDLRKMVEADKEDVESQDDSYVMRNQISPSEFNAQNQRYEADFYEDLTKKSVAQQFSQIKQPTDMRMNTTGYKNFTQDITRTHQKMLPPEKRDIVPRDSFSFLQQQQPEGKRKSGRGQLRYEGNFEKANNQVNQKQKSLEKIYLQRIDSKRNKKS